MLENNTIPLFDSLTHPTIDGEWILPRYKDAAKLDILLTQMREVHVKWAFAVGMRGIGNYSESKYIKKLSLAPTSNVKLFPIAFFEPHKSDEKNIKSKLLQIKESGYVGIKLHPRISNFSYNEHIADIIKAANDLDLCCLLCTYPYANNEASKNTPEKMMTLLRHLNGAKVVLLHSGTVRLLEYMEIARAFNNVLLDLSLTLCKYSGSSIDLDIAFLFKNFDRRICIGSDFPEFSLAEIRNRFEYFSQDIAFEKKENIAYKNLLNFCNLH